jgi:hypothetical protein
MYGKHSREPFYPQTIPTCEKCGTKRPYQELTNSRQAYVDAYSRFCFLDPNSSTFLDPNRNIVKNTKINLFFFNLTERWEQKINKSLTTEDLLRFGRVRSFFFTNNRTSHNMFGTYSKCLRYMSPHHLVLGPNTSTYHNGSLDHNYRKNIYTSPHARQNSSNINPYIHHTMGMYHVVMDVESHELECHSILDNTHKE